jgi:hypothetical protein
MPHLVTLSVSACASASVATLVSLLAAVRTQVPQLRQLEVHACASLQDGADVWQTLATLTQLDSLTVAADAHPVLGAAMDMQHLSLLSLLSGTLRQLAVSAEFVVWHTPPQSTPDSSGGSGSGSGGGDIVLRSKRKLAAAAPPAAAPSPPADALACLARCTALTSLALPHVRKKSIASLGSLSGLRSLKLQPAALDVPCDEPWSELTEADCAALGRLRQLSSLQLSHQFTGTPLAALCAALSRLTQLEELAFCEWSAEALPALAALPRLRCLRGCGKWRDRDTAPQPPLPGSAAVSLPGVTELWGHGCMPLEAFPNLRTFVQTGTVPPQVITTAAARCRQLKAWRVQIMAVRSRQSFDTSMDAHEALADRVAAINSMARLPPAIRELHFAPIDTWELIALAAVQLPPQLQELHVRPGGEGPRPVHMLQLLALAGLQPPPQRLVLDVSRVMRSVPPDWAPEEAVVALLSALRAVPDVRVHCDDQDLLDDVVAAVECAQDIGLPLPRAAQVCVVP